jgi:hypothetical protein
VVWIVSCRAFWLGRLAVGVIAAAEGTDAKVESSLKRLLLNATRISPKEGAPP